MRRIDPGQQVAEQHPVVGVGLAVLHHLNVRVRQGRELGGGQANVPPGLTGKAEGLGGGRPGSQDAGEN